jgi:phage terminase large subunit
MDFRPTTALRKIQQLRKRLRICQGGARAGKTIAILMCLIDLAGNPAYPNLIISVVSETMPHLKKGAMRDFIAIMTARGYWDPKAWNRSDSIYTFPNGAIIEFFSADSPDKVRGPGRDILFINECNNVPYETYRQLALRTRKIIYLDYNPITEFYVHTDLLSRPDADYAQLTYKDNEALPKALVREIELLKTNENLWRIYGLGEIGINEGQVFTNWDLSLAEPPPEARLERHGLDYGYTNDPSALVDIYRWNGGFVLDEALYATAQSNRMLADTIRVREGLPPVQEDGKYVGRTRILTIGDSAEPKSNDELKDSYGILITGAVKGEGSVNYGIQLLQQQQIYVTQRSTNIIKEYRTYLWKKDRLTDKPLNVPVDAFNHAMDASRYGISDILGGKHYEFRVRTA